MDFERDAGRKAETGSLPRAGARDATGSPSDKPWPRSARLLKRAEFDRVYAEGRRYSTPLFTAFLLKIGLGASRVGFTTPRGLGRAVQRNRIRRRLREAVRLRYATLEPGWHVVFNPRRAALDAEFAALEREVAKLFLSLK